MMQLTSGIWVAAHIRACTARGAFATVVRRGHEEAGVIYVCVRHAPSDDHPVGALSLFLQERGADGQLGWQAAYDDPQAEEIIEARLAREVKRDPDLWVLEVESCDGHGNLDIGR
ncbi:MAG: DUF1491 family protein [Pseudomonadota bacterium]